MEKTKTKFIMYSGLYTIGGVNVAIIYGKDRVIFEMGAAYDPKNNIYDGTVEKRKKNWIRDKLRLGILPAIDGLFRREDLGDYDLQSAEESQYNTAVFITHLHLDHMAHIGTVAPEIPIYMHKKAQIIERALEDVGQGVDTLPRKYRDLEPDKAIKVGEIEVYPILTNEDNYCDFAFLVTTPDGAIHWTGDLALHGKNAPQNIRQMEMLKEKNVDVLLCDCTSFMDDVMEMMYSTMDAKAILPSPDIPEGMLSDEEYEAALFEIIEAAPQLCVFNYYNREMTEAQQFVNWATAVGRKCVFQPDAAYIYYRFFNEKPNVYIPDVERFTVKDKPEWLKEILANCVLVTLDEIKANPRAYMIQNSYECILELFDLPGEKGVYVHSGGTPIGDFDPAYANMRKLVDLAGFEYTTFFKNNYFGHGYPCQVKYFVDEINPKVLIPCHSFNPERLLPKDGVQLLPELFKVYVLQDSKLVPEEEIQ